MKKPLLYLLPFLLLSSLALMFVTTIAHQALADISGEARIIDGDGIAIGSERIRLHGIDAPEQKQMCLMDGAEWACGQAAKTALEKMVKNNVVNCKGSKRDFRKRLLAVCYVGSLELNAQMVSEGWALAFRQYSKDYIPEEREAQNNSRGIWKSEFIPPWEWRRLSKQKTPVFDEESRKILKRTKDKENVPPTTNRVCCKVCKKGKPCGNSCIARNKTCRKGVGCAC